VAVADRLAQRVAIKRVVELAILIVHDPSQRSCDIIMTS
jgi:hypothetical protein